jgi:hypothetical protein
MMAQVQDMEAGGLKDGDQILRETSIDHDYMALQAGRGLSDVERRGSVGLLRQGCRGWGGV